MTRLCYICALLLLIAAGTRGEYEDVAREEWEEFKLRHGKTYRDEHEEFFRKQVFMSNKAKIAQHNQLYEKGLAKFRLEMNHFGDMLFHEFRNTVNGFLRNYRDRLFNGSLYLSPANVILPKEVDWRKEGYVTPVKDQGHCGSCWAFSTTGSLEGQHFKKTGKLVSLSEQNLVDCSSAYGNNGCDGGLMDQAFQYIKENHGIDTEESYPYVGKMHKKCRFTKKNVGATDTGFVDVPSGDERALKEAVATVGPISVAIDANHEEFMFYKEGVYDNVNCSSEELDHGVLVVGYGTTEDGDDYWIVKNSWGTVWGEEGYVRMARNKNNQCGIATSASYPLV